MYMYVYIISFHNDMQSGFRNIRIQAITRNSWSDCIFFFKFLVCSYDFLTARLFKNILIRRKAGKYYFDPVLKKNETGNSNLIYADILT